MSVTAEAERQDEQQMDVPKREEAIVPWLVCEACHFPLVSEAELIEEKFETWNKVTWAYELSVLGKESTWCYSATNAHDNRFDVVRALPSALGRSIICRGQPTPEYSWFPGFSWSMAHCRQCGRHLGWGFSPDAPPEVATEPRVAAEAQPGEVPAEPSPSSAAAAPGRTTAAVGGTAEQPLESQAAVEMDDNTEDLGEPVGTEEHSMEVEEQGAGGWESWSDSASSYSSGRMDTIWAGPGELRPPPQLQLAFFGLVLTKLREKDLTSAEAERRLHSCAEFMAQRHVQQVNVLEQPQEPAAAGVTDTDGTGNLAERRDGEARVEVVMEPQEQ
mmetsp:Transcript_97934/g.227093  ORF Transcript_97934/g.227093 Transcript_97934/m.227093 type:complete len:331 (-) Transcript_97934:77-1069(-)